MRLGLVTSEKITWDSKEEAAGKKERKKEGKNERRKGARKE
jgi:hypothetical protein